MINSIYLVFNSGRSGVTDLEQMVFNDGRPTFSRLREKEDFKDFKDFKVEHSTLVWSEELDLAAEYLFNICSMLLLWMNRTCRRNLMSTMIAEVI